MTLFTNCSFLASVALIKSFAKNTSFVAGSVATTAVGSGVGILSNFFIGNNLLLKLLRICSLVLNDNPMLFKITVS